MVIKKVKALVKGVCVKENKDYFSGELAGGLASIITATATSYALSELGIPNGINAVATYITQCTARVLATAAAYSYVHKKEEDPSGLETKKQAFQLIKLGGKASILTGFAKLSLHYGLLLTGIVPTSLAAPIAYSIPGIFSSYYVHKTNYKNGILCITNKNNNAVKQTIVKQKPASIDSIVS